MTWVLRKTMTEQDWNDIEEIIRRHCSSADECEAVRHCAAEILAISAPHRPGPNNEESLRVLLDRIRDDAAEDSYTWSDIDWLAKCLHAAGVEAPSGAIGLLEILASRKCEKFHSYGLRAEFSTTPSLKCQTEPCLVCRARATVTKATR